MVQKHTFLFLSDHTLHHQLREFWDLNSKWYTSIPVVAIPRDTDYVGANRRRWMSRYSNRKAPGEESGLQAVRRSRCFVRRDTSALLVGEIGINPKHFHILWNRPRMIRVRVGPSSHNWYRSYPAQPVTDLRERHGGSVSSLSSSMNTRSARVCVRNVYATNIARSGDQIKTKLKMYVKWE